MFWGGRQIVGFPFFLPNITYIQHDTTIIVRPIHSVRLITSLYQLGDHLFTKTFFHLYTNLFDRPDFIAKLEAYQLRYANHHINE